jgi:hypothetical protein
MQGVITMAGVPSNTREAQQPEKPGNVSPVVAISELTKQFGRLRAINNLNMTINGNDYVKLSDDAQTDSISLVIPGIWRY